MKAQLSVHRPPAPRPSPPPIAGERVPEGSGWGIRSGPPPPIRSDSNKGLPTACLAVILGGVIALGNVGCQSEKDSDWSRTGPAGSIADVNRKLGRSDPATANPDAATTSAPVVMLVVHDVEGKPLYAELQRSCGDPATDRRAVDFVLANRRFPKGAANTVSVTVDPKRLPKP